MASNPTSFLNASHLLELERQFRFGYEADYKEKQARFDKARQHYWSYSLDNASSKPDFIECMRLVKEAATNGKSYALCGPKVEVFREAFRALDLYTSNVNSMIASSSDTIAVQVTWHDPNR